MRTSKEKTRLGFTLVEMMTGLGCGSIILGALLAAGVSLQRSFAAVEGYAMATGDQLRVQDYIAMDCRRTADVVVDTGAWTNSGGTWSWVGDAAGTTTLIYTVPEYYAANGSSSAPFVNTTTGKISYGAGTSSWTGTLTDLTPVNNTGIPISYYQVGSNFIRQVGSNPAAAKPLGATAIATNVASFNVTPVDQSAVNGTVACSITFSPRFTTMAGPGPIAGTTIYAGTFLRNAQARK